MTLDELISFKIFLIPSSAGQISIRMILFSAIAMNLNAQSDYDCIGCDEFYIIKTGSGIKSISTSKACGLKSSKVAEQLFGTNYKAEKQFAETENAYYYKMVYDNGLELSVPENQKLNIDFHIRSDKYTMLLTNGITIKVGMKSDDLKAIFPKSFSKRVLINNGEGMIGKVKMMVYFSQLVDNKVIIFDSCIIFILSEGDGALEEFYTWEPS